MKYKKLNILFLALIYTFRLNAQSHNDKIEIKCKKSINVDLTHYHSYGGFTGSGDGSYAYSCYATIDVSTYSTKTYCSNYWENWGHGNYATNNTEVVLKNMCVSWGLYINGKEITTVGGLLEQIPATELLKVYDPNMVNN